MINSKLLFLLGVALGMTNLALGNATLEGQQLVFDLNTGITGQKIFVAGDLTMWEENWLQLTEVSTGNYHLAVPMPWLKKFAYKFVVDGKWQADPDNSKKEDDEQGGYNSILTLPFVEDSLLTANPKLPKWKTHKLNLTDLKGRKRVVTLATPPPERNREFADKRKVIVYFQDGDDYLKETKILALFSNLSNQEDMPLFYGVFVPPADRDSEYGLTPETDPYVKFLVDTVVPTAESKLGLNPKPSDRLVIGPSLGGVITLYTSFSRPEVFPQAASQSGAQEITDATLFNLMKASPNGRPEKLFLEIGLFEPKDWIAYTRRAHQVATDGGVPLQYKEYPSTHDWFGWRNRLSEIFQYFFLES